MRKFSERMLLVGMFILLLGCARRPAPTPTPSPVALIAPSPMTQSATLVPTFTAVPSPTPPPTATAALPSTGAAEEGEGPATGDFDELIVELRYSVPALGLDRRLQGNMANRITVVDETSGEVVEYSNQGGILLELRQALSGTELAPLPADCDTCVKVEYALSIEEKEDEGWLQDPVLLASIENFMSIALQPHFPPETVLGLRRSASPFFPSHSIALTAKNELWSWLATNETIPEATSTISETHPLWVALEALPLAEIGDEYMVKCDGSAVETLLLNRQGEALSINIICPEFSLPATLLPLYLELDALLAPVIEDVALTRPPAAFPLAALLDYKRADGARLTLFQDGNLVALDTKGMSYTSSLTTTQVLSLTGSLLDTDLIQPGTSTFMIEPTETITPGLATRTPEAVSVLIVRGPNGLYDGQWTGTPEDAALTELNALLNELTEIKVEEEIVETPAAAEPTSQVLTPTPTPTP